MADQQSDEQKRLDKLEKLVGQLVNSNKALMRQSDMQQRLIRRHEIKLDGLGSKINQLERNVRK